MEHRRNLDLLDIVVDTINSWNGESRASVHRTNVIITNSRWVSRDTGKKKKYTGFAIPAKIIEGLITFDANACKHAKTDRIYFVDVENRRMAWGPRVYAQGLANRAIGMHGKAEVTIDALSARLRAKDSTRFESRKAVINDQPKPVIVEKVEAAQPETVATAPKGNRSTYIKVRTQFEGFHRYPGASEIDPRIAFLEVKHRHVFKIEVTISVNHLDRELEFFLVKWALEDFIKGGDMNHKSCEMIGTEILDRHLIPRYGADRMYSVVVSEDGESDGIVVYNGVA